MISKTLPLPESNVQNSGNKNVTRDARCAVGSVEATLGVIGGKWKPIILYHLVFGTKRFGEIAVRIPNISRKVLTEQLKELENSKLIERKQYEEVPPRVEYSLTQLGQSLVPVFDEMAKWGNKHILPES